MNLLNYTIEHMIIVLVATGISVLIGVLFGVIAYRVKYLCFIILGTADIIQTIPSLALLSMLMIVFGLGNVTLIAGLVLYSLLPVIRNTYVGLSSVPDHLKDAARGMGMSKIQRMLQVELPLAFPLIFSGIKISIVTSLSIAVIGVLIGSGGLGSPIYRGILTQDIKQILSGGVPVVLLALVFDYLMSKIQNRLVKKAK